MILFFTFIDDVNKNILSKMFKIFFTYYILFVGKKVTHTPAPVI
jgi:hypothetical protein